MALMLIVFVLISIVLMILCYFFADSVADFLLKIIQFFGGEEDNE